MAINTETSNPSDTRFEDPEMQVELDLETVSIEDGDSSLSSSIQQSHKELSTEIKQSFASDKDIPKESFKSTDAPNKPSPQHPRENKFVLFLGLLLIFNTGFSNGVTLSGFLTPNMGYWTTQTTGGVSGAYTTSALALADTTRTVEGMPGAEYFAKQLAIILSFVGGAFLASVLNPRPVGWRLSPIYAPTFFIAALLMTIASILSCFEDHQSTEVHYYYFVAAANGVQNGLASMYSANLLRTAGVTGTTTDIGIFAGQLLRGNHKNTWKLKIQLGLVISWWFGGFSSFFAVSSWGPQALLFNTAVYIVLFALICVFLSVNLHLGVHKALIGTWHWQKAFNALSLRDSEGRPACDEKLLQVFRAMDTDGDNFLSETELREGLQKAHKQSSKDSKKEVAFVSDAKIHAMFAVCDRENRGKIGFDDWRDLVRGENLIVA